MIESALLLKVIKNTEKKIEKNNLPKAGSLLKDVSASIPVTGINS